MICRRLVYDWDHPGTGRVKEIEVKEHAYSYSGKTPCTGSIKCMFCGVHKEDEEEQHKHDDTPKNIMKSDFHTGFFKTLLWAEGLEDRYTIQNIKKADFDRLSQECDTFMHYNEKFFPGKEFSAGMDFYLTRQRHGAGFWDGDWKEHGDILTKASHLYRKLSVTPDEEEGTIEIS